MTPKSDEKEENASPFRLTCSVLSLFLYVFLPVVNFCLCFHISRVHHHDMHLGGSSGNPCNYDGSHVSNHMVGSVGIQNKYQISSGFDDFSNKEHQAGVRIVYEDVDCSGNTAATQGTPIKSPSHHHGGNCDSFIYDPAPRLKLFENNVLDKARHEKMGTMTYSTAHSVVVMGRPIPPPLEQKGDVEGGPLHGIEKQRHEERAREILLFESDAKRLKEYTEYLQQHVITGTDGTSIKESNIYPMNTGSGEGGPDRSHSIADRGGSFSLDNYQGLASFYKEDGILTREREREIASELYEGCREVYTQWVGARGGSACIAIAKVAPQYLTNSASKDSKDISHFKAKAPGIHRFDWNIDENNADKNYVPDPHHPKPQEFQGNEFNKGQFRPCGFFRKVPKIRGFQRVKEKLGPFVSNYAGTDGIGRQLDRKLELHNIKAGDDVTMMVVNEGEIDLFMNFACSCQQHGIDITNVFVFAASPEIVKLIESVGAMALFHPGYASVSKKASNDYLDRVFVDMMWYKSFSVHLLCLRGINVLFQDVDLVWFRNPFPYFHKYIETSKPRSILSGTSPIAFFSDDGQRSLRYSPFFANSGFYYLVGGYRSAHLAWSIMTAFDAVQVLGSHQNVFTLKMVEGLSVNAASSVLLSLKDFPNGIMYHHDKAYMKKLHARGYISDPSVSSESDKDKGEQYKYQLSVSMSSPHYPSPYHFHMCWTQGKPDKLKYLRLAQMWYLSDPCSPLEAYSSANTPKGDPNNNINSQNIQVERGSLIKYMQQTYNEVGASYAAKQHLSLQEDENGGVYLVDKNKADNKNFRGGKKRLDTSSADGAAYRSLQQGVAGHMVKHCCMSVPNAP